MNLKLRSVLLGVALIVLLFFVAFIRAVAADSRGGESITNRLEHYKSEQVTCERQAYSQTNVFIKGGRSIAWSSLGNLKPHLAFDGRNCYLDMVQGVFLFDGVHAYPDGLKGREINPGSVRFVVVAMMGAINGQCNDLKSCRRQVEDPRTIMSEWPVPLDIELDKYPGLRIRLKYPPPDRRNSDYLTKVIMISNSGIRRLVSCDGFRYPIINEHSKIELDGLLSMDAKQLQVIDFENSMAACKVGFEDFKFKSGEGRLSFQARNLGVVNEALPAIEQYMSESIK